jgi:acetyl esterase/lipase
MEHRIRKKRIIFGLCLAALLSAACSAQVPVLKIWPFLAPGTEGKQNEEKVEGGNFTNVYQPSLSVYLPRGRAESRPAMIVLPGGGYRQIVFRKEGTAIAEWLNKKGIAAFVLKYRLSPKEALQDAQRSASVIRSRAKEFGIDPKKIGVVGFSAGAHLAVNLAVHPKKEIVVDGIDSVRCSPDFVVLAYGTFSHFDSLVTDKFPPTFLVHAADDQRVPVAESVSFFTTLKKAGVPAELHIYEQGKHGFALEKERGVVATWCDRCLEWLRMRGIVRK